MTNPTDILRAHYAQRCQGELFLEAAQGGGINSQNYLVRIGAQDKAPALVLKSEVLGDNAPDWSSRLAFQQQVAQREPLVPQAVQTDDGQLGVELNGKLWRVLVYRHGNSFSGSAEEASSAASGLAHLHKSICDLPGAKQISPLYAHFSAQELAAVLEQLRGPLGATEFGTQVKQLVSEVLPPLTERLQKIEARNDLPTGWVHHDFHPGNALFAQGKLTAILDLDSLATDFRMQAVAFAASRFAGNDLHRLWTFLVAYHAVDPLTIGELQLMPDFIRREAVRRINWIIRVNVLQGQDLWRGDLLKQTGILTKAGELDATFTQPEGKLLGMINQPANTTGSGKP